MQTLEILAFARSQRAALGAQIAALDAFIAALTAPDEEPSPEPEPDPEPAPEPTPEPEPSPEPVPDPEPGPAPQPGPGPVPAPVPGGPGVRTVAELMTALANAKPGAAIPVAGKLGPVPLTGIRFASAVTLQGGEVESMTLTNCAGLRLQGMKMMPVGRVAAAGRAKPYLLRGDRLTSDIDVIGCDFWGGSDAPNFLNWSKAEWGAQKIGAVMFDGSRIRLADNAALAVNHGYNLTGDSCELTDNRVAGFSADAFRACCNNLKARGNWATDAYAIDANHPDGIQGFDQSATLHDQLWEDTIIMEYSTPGDTRGAIGASLQLIGFHNGPYANLTFRRFVGGSSSQNAYHVNSCPSHTAEKVVMFTQAGPKGGQTRLRVPSSSILSDIYLDKTTGAPLSGKPDYSKRAAFEVTALRGNTKPDLRAIMGW